MKINWKFVKFVLGMSVLIFLLSFSVHRYSSKPLEDIIIHIDYGEGKYFLNDSLVKRIIDNREMKLSQFTMGQIRVDQIENLLNDNPFVAHTEVYKDINGKLKIDLKQKTPIARINDGLNNEYYLAEDLSTIPLSSVYSAQVLLVGGNVDENDYEGIKNMIEIIKADKLLKNHVIAMRKEAPNSFNLLINKGDYIIEFGELERIEEKFENLKLFYEQYLGKVGLDYYEKINLKFNNQIVATKRESDEK